MIVTDIKEIYKKAQVGDILKYYPYRSLLAMDEVIESPITSIEECDECGEDFICNKLMFTVENEFVGCYVYGRKNKCSLISLYKEDFIKEDEFKI